MNSFIIIGSGTEYQKTNSFLSKIKSCMSNLIAINMSDIKHNLCKIIRRSLHYVVFVLFSELISLPFTALISIHVRIPLFYMFSSKVILAVPWDQIETGYLLTTGILKVHVSIDFIYF